MRPLVWFRTDLRVRDNTALFHACADADRGVVGVFAITPEQWKHKHDWGWPKADFTLRHARALSEELATLNIALRVVETPGYEELPEELLAIAREHGCDALYYNREYEINELDRDDAVSDAFEGAGRCVEAHTDLTLTAPGDIRTKAGDPYSVFTPFKKACFARWDERGAPEPLDSPAKQDKMVGAPDVVPEQLDAYAGGEAFRADLWTAGEHAALTRLGVFASQRLAGYKDDRDAPAINGTSSLSPSLAVGALSPRQCLRAAMDANNGRYTDGAQGPDTWISELLWRDFYKHFVVAFPRVVKRRPYKTETEAIAWDDNDDHLTAWKEGRTGFPIVDAATRQLEQTGWMHNRLRMIVAMFLTKDLFLDWRLGEKHFARRLVDYDFASNNGGWQWSASTGADAAPYFRVYNPTSQSKRHDPEGAFIKAFVPELAGLDKKTIHEPSRDGSLFAGDYPAPIVDHACARERAIDAFRALKTTQA